MILVEASQQTFLNIKGFKKVSNTDKSMFAIQVYFKLILLSTLNNYFSIGIYQ